MKRGGNVTEDVVGSVRFPSLLSLRKGLNGYLLQLEEGNVKVVAVIFQFENMDMN